MMTEDNSPIKEIADVVNLRRRGSRWVGLCPFHAEKKPSFTVTEEGMWNCFGCGVGGDVFDFMRMNATIERRPEKVEDDLELVDHEKVGLEYLCFWARFLADQTNVVRDRCATLRMDPKNLDFKLELARDLLSEASEIIGREPDIDPDWQPTDVTDDTIPF